MERLARGVREAYPTAVVAIGPERYNALYAKMGNLNRLLAWAHARVIDHKGFARREDFDRAVVAALHEAGVELVLLAGFDRLVTPVLLAAFPLRVMNVHPALLPSFKGLDAQRQALAYGVRIAGATVHFVDEHTDHGPIIVQGAVAISPEDSEDEVRRRILAVEHDIYPLAIQLFAEGRLTVEGRRVIVRGPRPRLPPPLVHW